MSQSHDPEMVGLFLDEVEEQLQFLEEGILTLEQKGEDPEVIQTVFRVAHTLKGSSAVMGFEEMKHLTHEMENVLDKIRNNAIKIDMELINLLFLCLDALRALKVDFVKDREHIKTDISEMVGLLKWQLEEKMGEKDTLPSDGEIVIKDEKSTAEPLFHLNEDQVSQIEEALRSGFYIYDVHISLVPEAQLKIVRACVALNYLNEQGVVVETHPNLSEESHTDESSFNYLLISVQPTKELEASIFKDLLEIETVEVRPFSLKPPQEVQEAVGEIEKMDSKKEPVKLETPTENLKEEAAPKNNKVSQTVRVDIERLEKMMNLVGELVIEQTRIALVGSQLYSRYPSDMAVDDLVGISNHISRVINELQEGVMKARMLPIQQLFNRFPRMVRDLAQTLGKDVTLVLEGGETEMDRTIIEDITDPLIHLIRNAVDHGIEEPALRESLGKPANGQLRIRAYHQENHVYISIEDDGKGIDPEKMKASAVKKRLITQLEADGMNAYQAIQLIFAAGFSTAQEISDISGRGVGMDIVKSHIEKLNGIIDVSSIVGQGTHFQIKLPLTLAILTGLLVKIGEEIYALPMNNVLEIIRKPVSEVEFIKNQAVVVIRERVLPLVWLHDNFNMPRPDISGGGHIFVVILGMAEKRIGLVVDALLGNQEIVVKPLGSYMGKIEGFSGATILGDGSVACILDVVGISKLATAQRVLDTDL